MDLEQPATKHARKMEALSKSFADNFEANCTAYAVGAPLRAKLHLERVARQVAATQEAVDNLVMQQTALHADCGRVSVKKMRNVVCFHLSFKMVVQVPTLVFSCGEQWTVHPFMVGYAPTTATDGCETWVGEDEVMVLKDMMYANGLSASGEPHDARSHSPATAAAWLYLCVPLFTIAQCR